MLQAGKLAPRGVRLGATVIDQFWERGYSVIEGLLDQSKLDLAAASLNYTRNNHEMRERNSGCVLKARDEYSPAVGEMLLRHCQPTFEDAIGRPLLSSFAYWRIYEHGAELKRHVDRPGCEISATMPIASDPNDSDWPIMCKDKLGNEAAIHLKPGSALLYQGHEVEHWREPFTGKAHFQMCFHYVLEGGQYTELNFDGREEDPVAGYYGAS